MARFLLFASLCLILAVSNILGYCSNTAATNWCQTHYAGSTCCFNAYCCQAPYTQCCANDPTYCCPAASPVCCGNHSGCCGSDSYCCLQNGTMKCCKRSRQDGEPVAVYSAVGGLAKSAKK